MLWKNVEHMVTRIVSHHTLFPGVHRSKRRKPYSRATFHISTVPTSSTIDKEIIEKKNSGGAEEAWNSRFYAKSCCKAFT